MCGRFSQQRPASELAEIFAAEPLTEELGPRFNIAPTDDALVVVQRDDRRAIAAYRWGLIPFWADAAKVGSRMFNARAETLTSSPAFRDALRRKRCLVPVDGFYEGRRESTRRQPFLIAPADGRPLALAGLWSGWRDPSIDRVVRTFTIVTAGPNAQVAELHDRMPVIVPEAAWSTWLDPLHDDQGELQALLQPNEDVDLRIVPVSRLVNDVRNDGPALIEPVVLENAVAEQMAPPPGFFD
jgi:putative SOS response-associated peptidase YedK